MHILYIYGPLKVTPFTFLIHYLVSIISTHCFNEKKKCFHNLSSKFMKIVKSNFKHLSILGILAFLKFYNNAVIIIVIVNVNLIKVI